MNKLSIRYDLNKDAENFIKGKNSINSQIPTKFQQEYENSNDSDYSEEKVRLFLELRGKDINFEQIAIKIKDQWNPIENEFVLRCEEIFGIRLESEVIGYLSQNQKCTYNWRENYFFIYYNSLNPLKTIMHELLHFYTHRKYDSFVIDSNKFNDIKESLTVLLNVDFADLMNGEEDRGYEQHQQMRSEILCMRKEGSTIDQIFNTLAQ